ncbi:hypothetical protein D3C75_1035270 [compost metagenome]
MAGGGRDAIDQGRAAHKDSPLGVTGHQQPEPRQPARQTVHGTGKQQHAERQGQTAALQGMAGIEATRPQLAEPGEHQVGRDEIAEQPQIPHPQQLAHHLGAYCQQAGRHRPGGEERQGAEQEPGPRGPEPLPQGSPALPAR